MSFVDKARYKARDKVWLRALARLWKGERDEQGEKDETTGTGNADNGAKVLRVADESVDAGTNGGSGTAAHGTDGVLAQRVSLLRHQGDQAAADDAIPQVKHYKSASTFADPITREPPIKDSDFPHLAGLARLGST